MVTAEQLVVSWLTDLGLKPTIWKGHHHPAYKVSYTKWESGTWRIVLYEDLTFVGYHIANCSYLVIQLINPSSTQQVEAWIKANK